MTRDELIEEIKLVVSAGILKLAVSDLTIDRIINTSLREISRYWDETRWITVPFATCIDLTGWDHISVEQVVKAEAYGATDTTLMMDPMYIQQYNMFGGGTGLTYNLSQYLLNYASWVTMAQIRNTITTELDWEENKQDNKLYINNILGGSSKVTIKYIPNITDVEDIKTQYWIDNLVKMCVAKTKIEEGRIRTRYTLSNAPYAQDGDKILEEGNTELKELREQLTTNDNVFMLID